MARTKQIFTLDKVLKLHSTINLTDLVKNQQQEVTRKRSNLIAKMGFQGRNQDYFEVVTYRIMDLPGLQAEISLIFQAFANI